MALTLFTTLAPMSALADDGSCSKPTFFGLEPWYQYLPYESDGTTHRCEINASSDPDSVLGEQSFFLLIILAIVDDLLRLAGMVAVVFLIIGGIKYITAAGSPEQAASAKNTIVYAMIGLVIAIIAIVIVSFTGHTLGA